MVSEIPEEVKTEMIRDGVVFPLVCARADREELLVKLYAFWLTKREVLKAGMSLMKTISEADYPRGVDFNEPYDMVMGFLEDIARKMRKVASEQDVYHVA